MARMNPLRDLYWKWRLRRLDRWAARHEIPPRPPLEELLERIDKERTGPRREFRVFIAKHPCDDEPFIWGTDPDPRDEAFDRFRWDGDSFGDEYSGWYVREKNMRPMRWCLFHDSTAKSDPEHPACRIADRSQTPHTAYLNCRIVDARLHIPEVAEHLGGREQAASTDGEAEREM